MSKPDERNAQESGLFLGSEPIDGSVYERSAMADRDRKDAGGAGGQDKGDKDKGDDDSSDKGDTDGTDKGDGGDDSRDADGKD